MYPRFWISASTILDPFSSKKLTIQIYRLIQPIISNLKLGIEITRCTGRGNPKIQRSHCVNIDKYPVCLPKNYFSELRIRAISTVNINSTSLLYNRLNMLICLR